ncbi:MAG: hypothetical protein NTW04_03695 [Elusimicrobia bacterium]|nr:hypothetical protein [Elusimicrobiota bacterium]
MADEAIYHNAVIASFCEAIYHFNKVFFHLIDRLLRQCASLPRNDIENNPAYVFLLELA